MKKLLYVFIGIAIALGAVVLYSFKAKENAEVSYVIIMGSRFTNKVSVYYDNGQEENAETLLDVKVGDNRDKGQLPFRNAVIKTLKHMTQKGYRVVGFSTSQDGNSSYADLYYTLIKEN